jgi:DNA-binding LytR/AlgR family response regulator
MNLKTIQQKPNPHDFMRVSKSYTVNLQGVDSFDTHNLYIGGYELPLGEVCKDEFFGRFWATSPDKKSHRQVSPPVAV